jgi:predicted membrane protein (TIGR00267 family)
MSSLQDLRFLLHISRSHAILRRYIVVNGFDGALTMLGLLVGFRVSPAVPLETMIAACIGAAVALGVSGLSSAFISETAERRLSLKELEDAMIRDMESTAHGRAARVVPYLIAASNGLSPLLISLCIISPLWLAAAGLALPLLPLDAAIALTFSIIFLLGAYLGRIGQTFWLTGGLKALLVAALTAAVIFLLNGTG